MFLLLLSFLFADYVSAAGFANLAETVISRFKQADWKEIGQKTRENTNDLARDAVELIHSGCFSDIPKPITAAKFVDAYKKAKQRQMNGDCK